MPQAVIAVVDHPPDGGDRSRSKGSSPDEPERHVAPLILERLVVRDLRNLEQVDLRPSARLNVLCGANGQGKTSILEAIYLLATSRSFRTARLGELIRHGAHLGVSRGCYREPISGGGSLPHEQSCAVERGRRTLRVDGEPATSAADFAVRLPVVVFEPQQLALTAGPAAGRRTLIDRVCLFVVPGYPANRARYRRALDARQALLVAGPDACVRSSNELGAFEALLADHGALLTEARHRAVGELADRAIAAYAEFGAPGSRLEVAYRPGGSADTERARAELARARRSDARRRRATFGPHVDELELRLDGHPIRTVGSQGQHRAVTLALKIAELGCIAAARRAQPILLLDDVSSELDAERAAALFRHLATGRGQIFLTTTRRGLIVAPELTGGERADFELVAGVVSAC